MSRNKGPVCGFCYTNSHDKCTRGQQRWIAEYKKVGRVKTYTITMLDSYRVCECKNKEHK